MSNSLEISIVKLVKAMDMALISEGKEFNWLTDRCCNQASLASVENRSLGIVPMTLNTFKKYSDEFIIGGFKEVDFRRKKIIKKLNGGKVPIKKNYNDELIRLRDRLDKAERARAIILRAYDELNKIMLDLLSDGTRASFDYDQHREIYKKYFGLHVVEKNDK